MKRILVLSITVLGIILASCNSILEVKPLNSVDPSAALTDANSYQALLVSVYDRYQSFTWGGRDMVLLGDALADNAYVVNSQSGGRYVANNINTKGQTYNIWPEVYPAINECNILIAGVDKAKDAVGKAAFVKQLKGEALFMRALSYFQLATIYGYEPTKVPTSGQGVGFDKSAILHLDPISDAVVAAKLGSRATQTDVYNAIEADLLAAITLLPVDGGRSGVTRANLGAAYALLGKVYLYWEKWAQAEANLKLALQNTSAAKIGVGANAYMNAFKQVIHPESLFEISYVQSVEVAGVTGVNNTNFSYTQPTVKNPLGLSTYGGMTPSAELLGLFEGTDNRLNAFYASNTATTTTVYTWCNKYNGSGGIYTDNIKVIRYSDVILMQAEAVAMQGRYTEAQVLVKALRDDRGAVLPTPTDATIIDFIQTERRRELFFEGQRFFDLKRRGSPIPKPAATAVGTIAYEDFRLLAPLPNSEVILNPTGLPQNPNY